MGGEILSAAHAVYHAEIARKTDREDGPVDDPFLIPDTKYVFHQSASPYVKDHTVTVLDLKEFVTLPPLLPRASLGARVKTLAEETNYPAFATIGELKHHLTTEAPLQVAYFPKSRMLSVPQKDRLIEAVETHVRGTIQARGENPDEGGELDLARTALESIYSYVEGTVVVDQFDTNGENHDLRSDWKKIMTKCYGDTFRGAYIAINQLSGQRMTHAASMLGALAIYFMDNPELSDQLYAHCEELTEARDTYDALSLERKIAFVRMYEDVCVQSLLLVNEHVGNHPKEAVIAT